MASSSSPNNPTNAVNQVSFDAEFTSADGAEGLLSVYWDTSTIGTLDERFTAPGTQHYSFTFPNANANSVHVLGFRLDPFTNIQSTIMITNVVMNQVGPSQPFSLSVTTNTIGGLLVYQLTGQAGFDYDVQVSTNLTSTNWSDMAILVNTNGTVNFYDPDTVRYPMKFYRAVWSQ